MKKLTAILLGTLIASSAVLAQTNQVLSRNAVGYVKIPLQSNRLYLVSNPFFSLQPGPVLLTNIFAVVPPNTSIRVWDEASQAYIGYSRNRSGVWLGSATTATVTRGDGIFITTPATSAPVDLFLMGEVPDRFTSPSNQSTRAQGITMLGFPYPVTMRLTNTALGLAIPPNGSVSVWDPANNSYIGYSKNRSGVWLGAALTADITPGQGLVIRATNIANSWFENKPYTWP